MIEFRDVGKAYPDGTVALRSLSLTAREGQITVLVGPSGCGKTTTLRMVNRMVDPTSGQVLLDGADVGGRDPAALRRGIGYVIQNAGLFPHRTVLDNVATVPVLLGRSRREARTTAAELLERVGLDPRVGSRYPAQLSGGQQQRVGVARALAGDAPVLLMDEPFSAVDPVVRADLQDELLRLQSDLGRTILFVTHDIDEAIRLGDMVAVLRVGGTLAQFAHPAELLSSPADDFVAEFVGRDRGYRRLQFLGAGELTLTDLPTGPDDGEGGWVLVLDDDRRPVTWRHDGQDVAVGSLYRADGGSLRGALDAALSSPSGRGVAVDGDGRLLGGIDAEAVIALLHRSSDPAGAAR
ncbi:ATP-binding cassette domain-containing protein [Actinomycetospora endophytica]|uniref:ATP-binding cassette domain-containing protein n=1 Tax=Actinomycetospora endophytica TaxID=2291215 RepID=A0ABS8PJ20_9PSEU|nr:ATP-binding cassette domain-containing protein [Actinomycetospora endophytica]MCD2197495.1 ATP-binding cassette domain-containing protein [Actinomycetospora endophytica]